MFAAPRHTKLQSSAFDVFSEEFVNHDHRHLLSALGPPVSGASVSHASKIETLLGSIEVNPMPIPANSREYATLPWATKVVPS